MSNKSRHDVSRTNWDVSRFRGDVFKNVFMNIFAPSLDKDVKATKNGCDTALRNVDYLLFNHRFDFIYRNFSRKRASKSVC